MHVAALGEATADQVHDLELSEGLLVEVVQWYQALVWERVEGRDVLASCDRAYDTLLRGRWCVGRLG